MKKTFWTIVVLALGAGRALALTPACLHHYQDCWREPLESEGAAIAAQAREAAKAPGIREGGRRLPEKSKLGVSPLKLEMLRAILEAYLEPADALGNRRIKESGRIFADFSGAYPSPEGDEILETYGFLELEGGIGRLGIGAHVEPDYARGQFYVIRDDLFNLVKRAKSAGAEVPAVDAVGLWACETRIVRPREAAVGGIFNEEECHLLFQ